MANEKRLIDANALLEIYKKWIPQLANPEDNGDRRGVETCIAVLEDAPTIAAVEVVRCKDCKHRYSDSWCEYVDDDDNFYCARGERKKGNGNG